jgi:hypothetical protein
VRFQVFKNGQPLDSFEASGAYLFGADGAGIRRSKVVFENGLLQCFKPTAESAALALVWPVEGFGRILLPTTCLPDRDRAYCLNVEVARARLMQIINRREEWSWFDNSKDLEEITKEAQDLFVKAVQRIRDPVVASQLADRSLRRAMVLSERVTLAHAEAMFKARRKARRKAKAIGRGCIGCRVDLDRVGQAGYMERFCQVGGFAVIPTTWATLEPAMGQYDFSLVDQAIHLLSGQRLILGLGPLLSFSRLDLPAWVIEQRMGFEQIREAAFRYIGTIAARYSRRIHRWFLVSGLNASNELGFTVEQVREIVNAAALAVRAANSRAFRIVEITSPWGEYYASVPNTISPIGFMDMLVQSGIGFEAFAVQLKFGKDQPGLHVRDLMQIASLLDVYSLLGKPLFVTGLEAPSTQGQGPFDVQAAGFWHKPWDQVRQAVWLEDICRVALGRPWVEAVVFEHLVDTADSVIQHSGLLTETMEPKDSFNTICRFREGIG